MTKDLSCFKAYDIRGKLNDNFDEEICYRIGRSFAEVCKLRRAVIGYDARETSPGLAQSVSRGMIDQGVEVFGIGLSGTEEMYHATSEFEVCGGVHVTASHNPLEYNGIKLVGRGSRPLHPLNEFALIKVKAEENTFEKSKVFGNFKDISKVARDRYVLKVLEFVNLNKIKPLKIVINSGNGAAGPTFDVLEKKLLPRVNGLEFVKVFHEPDSSFPNGIPNPLIPENHSSTISKIHEHRADLGVAFDGDFDRCFFFDEKGRFVPSEYIVGLLAQIFLLKEPRATIVHDPRIIWNIQDVVEHFGGKSVQTRTGHGFVKRAMRDSNAIYGGEMSAHHYFRDFYYCDSGMIPWLLVVELLCESGLSLSELISKRALAFPSSGERNFEISNDPEVAIQAVVSKYEGIAKKKDFTDGISFEFENWRFNIRQSNTEPLVRLNIETRGDKKLMTERLKAIESILKC